MAIKYTSSFDETISFSDTDAQIGLTAGLEQTYTIPGTSKQKFNVLFGMSSNANVFVGYNVTATVPAANSVETTQGIEFMTPDSKRYVIGGDVLHFITPDATAWVGVSVRGITS